MIVRKYCALFRSVYFKQKRNQEIELMSANDYDGNVVDDSIVKHISWLFCEPTIREEFCSICLEKSGQHVADKCNLLLVIS